MPAYISLPHQIRVVVRATPWGEALDGRSGDGAHIEDGSDGGTEGSKVGQVVLEFSLFRDEFLQEGPSGPIEAKRVLLLTALPLQVPRCPHADLHSERVRLLALPRSLPCSP